MGPLLRSSGDNQPGVYHMAYGRLQWGRCFAAAETESAVSEAFCDSWLQWGRCFAAAETRPDIVSLHIGTVLQWGRCFAAAETWRT